MLFHVKDITVHYGRIQAVNKLSVSVSEMGRVALIGANGAGKSTTLRAISGLIPLSSGEIWFEGRRIDGMRPDKIVKCGIVHVPQGKGLFSDMTVIENLEMGAYLRKNNSKLKTDLDKIYEDFPILGARKSQIAASLSGGEQQMLSIARALMAKPKLLLMDEPTLGLAPIMVREIEALIEKIERQGISVLLVEQNARIALKLSQYGYVMETGKSVLEGKSEELLNNINVKRAYLGA